MSREDVVEVNILVKKDVSPQGFRKGGAVHSNDEGMFGLPNVNVVIFSEGESECNVGINGAGHNWNICPWVH